MDNSFSSMDYSGSLQVIFGPMFSGKTTELMRRIRRYSIARKSCVVIKYQADTRYDVGNAVTHDQQQCPAVPCMKLQDAEKAVENCDVIGIDEGQFFPDLVKFCDKWSNEGKIIVVAALDGTFQKKPFGSVLQLVPLAEKVTKLSAVCMVCCDAASFTHRMSTEKEVEVIGGADKYLALCRQCYNAHNPSNFINIASALGKKRSHSDLSLNTFSSPGPVEKRSRIATAC